MKISRAKAASGSSEKASIAHAILTYLSEHPDAQDTLEGIVEWWLLERKISHQAKTVKEVLDTLVSTAQIDEVKRGNKTYYQLIEQK